MKRSNRQTETHGVAILPRTRASLWHDVRSRWLTSLLATALLGVSPLSACTVNTTEPGSSNGHKDAGDEPDDQEPEDRKDASANKDASASDDDDDDDDDASSAAGDGGSGHQDAAMDASADTGPSSDASADAGSDANTEAGSDASTEAGADATLPIDNAITGGYTGVSGSSGPLSFAVATANEHAVPGSTLQYLIAVSNTSSTAVDGVRVTLRVPVGLEFNYAADTQPNAAGYCAGNALCSANEEAVWTLGSIGPGTSSVISVNNAILTSVGEGDSISAQVRFEATGVSTTNVTKLVAVHPTPATQLALLTAKDRYQPGESFLYSVQLGHVGATALAGTELHLTLPSGLIVDQISDGGTNAGSGEIVWNIGDVAVGFALERSVKVTLSAAAKPGQLLTARSTLLKGGSVDSAAEQVITVLDQQPPLRVEVSAVGPITPDGRMLLGVTVGNRASRAVENVALLLRVPAGAQFGYAADVQPVSAGYCNGNALCSNHEEALWNLGTITAGHSQTVTINALAPATLVGDGKLLVTRLELSADGMSPLRLIKALPVHGTPQAQLYLSSAANPITPGQSFSIDLDVGQVGNNALHGTELRLRLPAGLEAKTISNSGNQAANGDVTWTLGDVAVGGSVHRSIEVTPRSDVVAGDVLQARAELTFQGGLALDATAEIAVPVILDTLPLQLQISAAPNPVVPGNRVLYTATITNRSNRAMNGIVFNTRVAASMQFGYAADAEPDAAGYCNGNALCSAGEEASWNIGALAAGANQLVTINAEVLSTLVAGSLLYVPFRLSATAMDTPIYVSTTTRTQ